MFSPSIKSRYAWLYIVSCAVLLILQIYDLLLIHFIMHFCFHWFSNPSYKQYQYISNMQYFLYY